MAGTYKAYPEYKESGVEWLGEIPSGWVVLNSRRMFGQRKERARKEDKQLTASQKYGVIFQKEFMEREGQRVVQVLTGSEILKHVEPDDFVISMRSFQGGLEWCKYAGSVSSAYVGLIPIKHVAPEFFSYLFKSKPYIQALQSTSNLVRDGQALRFDNFSLIALPVLSLPEQQQIARFLDHETAKIDRLIERQERLIGLLEEKRQAVISHAVTKGLNPDAPLRPSGIDWLGDMPEHWDVSKFSYAKTVLTDYTANGSFADLKKNVTYLDEPSYARLIRLTDLRKGLKNDNGVWIDKASYTYLKKSSLLGGEFLLANVGAYAGLFYEMPENAGHASLAPNMFMAKFDEAMLHRKFIAYVSQGTAVNSQLVLAATASSAQPKLNKEDFKSVLFAYPCKLEQKEIVNFLDNTLKTHDLLITKAQSAIDLLKERRTALISAAVTGKIDVRDWEPPKDSFQPPEESASLTRVSA
ncbi:restriction endonuclease subunit S [Pseudovibrio sp. Ad26]|uniref:restriction endonuclease subunit S n=1 Tax=Pseudovibrio sp. Ad26 TaxID=989410 RepID=UPI0007AE6BC2|nr:restriction endonuclease subunit S [Pseudovibrio sp. Ad26]KZL09821.1 Type-1 restriction enzyme EcoKI specificity protein [Pseudovibrio sp. Ad26]